MSMNKSTSRLLPRANQILRSYSTAPSKASNDPPLYLNPHKWEGLPADRIFELHNLRKKVLADKYNPDDAERSAILSTIVALGETKPGLDYVYEIDNFKERHMNNLKPSDRGKPPKYSNIPVLDKGKTPHEIRKIEHLHRVSAYEIPLLAKFRQEYKPQPESQTPLRLTYHSDFTDESNAYNRKVTLFASIKDLGLNEIQARKFKILSGNKFNHDDNTIKFSSDRYSEATQNSRHLVDTFNKLLSESKDLSKDSFKDIPIDTRHMRTKKVKAQFPDSWKRPEDAPSTQHKIVRKLVEDVKERKDKQYISKYLP